MERIERIIEEFILKSVNDSQKKGVVVPLSGGIDSATTAKLVVEAIGGKNVHAIILPHGELTKKEETEDALFMAKHLGIDFSVIDIKLVIQSCFDIWKSPENPDILYEGVFISRTRMMFSRMLADEMNYLVAGCGNKTEGHLGNFVKAGVGLGDIFPIGELFKTEVYKIAKIINIPRKIIQKKPEGGFVDEVPDEIIFGPYEITDKILFRLLEEQTTRRISEELELSEKFVKFIAKQFNQSREKVSYKNFSLPEQFSSKRKGYLE